MIHTATDFDLRPRNTFGLRASCSRWIEYTSDDDIPSVIAMLEGKKKWCRFFEVFGVNPLFLYVLGAVLSILIGFIKVPSASAASGSISLKGYIYQDILIPICGDDTLASLVFAISFVLVNWIVGYALYKKKIYIKI